MNEALRVAIAEDEPIVLRDLQETLTELGHQVVATATDGRKLVEQCRTTQPDLVITDIKMPDMDGLDASLAIAKHRPTPVIIVSAYHDPELIERAEAGHVLAYLVKPLQNGSLAASIGIAMRRWREFQAINDQSRSLMQALEDRKLMERAKGILMKRAGLSEEDAFLRLQKMSRTKSKKMIEIAQSIIEAEDAFEL